MKLKCGSPISQGRDSLACLESEREVWGLVYGLELNHLTLGPELVAITLYHLLGGLWHDRCKALSKWLNDTHKFSQPKLASGHGRNNPRTWKRTLGWTSDFFVFLFLPLGCGKPILLTLLCLPINLFSPKINYVLILRKKTAISESVAWIQWLGVIFQNT